VKGEKYEKHLEHVYSSADGKHAIKDMDHSDSRIKIVKRTIKEFKNGMYVTLGLGIPSLIPDFLTTDLKVNIHSNSGVMGIGPYPKYGEENADLINSNREAVTILPGGSTFSSKISLNMLRGGHMNLSIVGGLQVSKSGDLANWIMPGKYVKGMGSSMDSVIHESTKVIVTMLHTFEGGSKLVKECTLPLTAKKCVDLLITELGVFDFNREDGVTLIEIAKGTTLSQIKENTGCSFVIASDLKEMQQ